MDATNISSFDMNVVNTKKFVPLLCSCFLARAENSGKKLLLLSTQEFVQKSRA